jgi:protein phosphatase
VVAHAGLPERYHGRASARVRTFCLYGETNGETDEFGLPVRYDWARDYRGDAMVIYGHTPVLEPEWVNKTLCLDTGCVFGGKLSALRYPEREIVQVTAGGTYYASPKPLAAAPVEQRPHQLLDIEDVAGKRILDTRLRRSVTLREENTAAALEVLSRFGIDPRWLIYLPPTMSPPEAAPEGSPELERPEEVFGHFRTQGVERVICQEKHMGSRALLIVGKSAEALERRFQVPPEAPGIIYTRTGRPFFSDPAFEGHILRELQDALAASGLWDELATDWVCLDAEILPWSFKAEALIQDQYAAVGAAGEMGLSGAVAALRGAAARDEGAGEILARFAARLERVERYGQAWRRYTRRVTTPAEIRVAPFHLLASEGRVHMDRPHDWHMAVAARLAEHAPGIEATAHRVVELEDPAACAAARAWWDEITASGSEGMVVKPLEWIVYGKKGLVQPAIKCRGREYLRIIYGPEYDAPENLERLRKRALSRKRSLALREFTLGYEALHRFVEGEPLWRVHPYVFGVLALESEPVDPRL